MHSTSTLIQRAYPFRTLLSWLALVASWVLLFYTLVIMTWAWNAYDAVPPQQIPQSGWEHTLYQMLVVANIRSWLILGLGLLSVVWVGVLYARVHSQPLLALRVVQRVAVINMVFVLAIALLGGLVAVLPLHLAPPPSYGYALKHIIKDVLVLGLWAGWWLRLQPRSLHS